MSGCIDCGKGFQSYKNGASGSQGPVCIRHQKSSVKGSAKALYGKETDQVLMKGTDDQILAVAVDNKELKPEEVFQLVSDMRKRNADKEILPEPKLDPFKYLKEKQKADGKLLRDSRKSFNDLKTAGFTIKDLLSWNGNIPDQVNPIIKGMDKKDLETKIKASMTYAATQSEMKDRRDSIKIEKKDKRIKDLEEKEAARVKDKEAKDEEKAKAKHAALIERNKKAKAKLQERQDKNAKAKNEKVRKLLAKHDISQEDIDFYHRGKQRGTFFKSMARNIPHMGVNTIKFVMKTTFTFTAAIAPMRSLNRHYLKLARSIHYSGTKRKSEKQLRHEDTIKSLRGLNYSDFRTNLSKGCYGNLSSKEIRKIETVKLYVTKLTRMANDEKSPNQQHAQYLMRTINAGKLEKHRDKSKTNYKKYYKQKKPKFFI
jgi:hypothetical protein